MQAAVARRVVISRHLLGLRRRPVCFRRYSLKAEQRKEGSSSLGRATPYILGLGVATTIGLYLFYPDQYRGAPTLESATLAPTHFTPSLVLSNEYSGPDTKILELQVPPNLLPEDKSSFAPIWSVYIKDDDIQVERPYTPLEGIDEEGRMRFWIKKYPVGEVGRWLHTKTPGQKIELRGPLSTWAWKEDEEWDEVVMISGGTGFTPFYQLFHTVISRPSATHRTRFTLLHSSRVPSQLPPSQLLDPLFSFAEKNPDKLSIQLFVDSLEESTANPNVQVTRIGRPAIEKALGLEKPQASWWTRFFGGQPPSLALPKDKKILFLVCGPDPMISAISGPWGRNFSQGPIQGILGDMGFDNDQVRKL